MRQPTAPTVELIDAVAASVAAFGPRTNRFPVYAEPPPGAEIVTATDLLQPDTLRRFFVRALSLWPVDPDSGRLLAAAASRFMRRYCGSLASATLIPLAHGVAVDVLPARVAFVVREELPQGIVLDLIGDDLAVSPARPTRWPVDPATRLDTTTELRERALRSLFAGNIVPAFDRVHEASHLAHRVMWSTMAEQIAELYETALAAAAGVAPQILTADRDRLMSAEPLPGVAGENPLRTNLSWDEPNLPRRFQRRFQREHCCVCYVIPDRFGAGHGAHCARCPRIVDVVDAR